MKVRVSHDVAVRRVPGAKRREVLNWQTGDRDEKMAQVIDRYREIVNFKYWRPRSD